MKTIRLLTLLGSLVWLASCSSDNDELFPDPNGNGQIKFEMSFAGEEDNSPKTKVSTESNFTSSWLNGDKVGVYIVKGSRGLLASGNYADNVEFIYNNGIWTTATSLYYPNDGDNLNFYAYYPYDAGMTNPNTYIFNVSVNQDVNYLKDDFLWAKVENVSKSNNAVALQFSHALAMIELAIADNASTLSKVNLLEVITDCTINLAVQSIAPGSTKKTIQMRRVYIFNDEAFFDWVLTPPQTMDIRFVWKKNNITYTISPATNVTLTSGNIKKYSTIQP